MKALIELVAQHWGWSGIAPAEVVAISPFGQLIVRDVADAFWHLDPDLGECVKVAGDLAGLARHRADPDVREVWDAAALVEQAREQVGEPGPGRCYALKMPALLGGDFVADNLTTLPLAELIGLTGDLAGQLRDLPAGTPVKITITD